ncbi:MAG TPA: hypothetical protein VFD43_02220, partial [Planctomycetota bacterium]|nr:hypothetical protein [Planctomycetota bacterium]
MPALPAFAGVIVVAPSGGAFTSLEDSVDAAIEGDTILVKPGVVPSGFVFVDGKSLTIVGDAPTPVHAAENLSIWNLAAGQHVTLRNLTLRQSTLLSNAGSVWIEDCSYTALSQGPTEVIGNCVGAYDPFATPSFGAVECASVTLVRCTFLGGAGHDGYTGGGMTVGLSTDGGAGVRVQSSTVAAYECMLSGGKGGGGEAWCDFLGDGGPGLSGLASFPFNPDVGSKVLLSGCTLVGGDA